MTAFEYAAMYRAVPSRHGLAAVGNAFLLEAGDRARKLETRDEIEATGTMMTAKWREFCALVADLELQPEPAAYDGLTQMLLTKRGF
jgi:hypothetical protein